MSPAGAWLALMGGGERWNRTTPVSNAVRRWLENRAPVEADFADVSRWHIGRFGTEEEAALAYDEAARSLHGSEFARVNFPRDGERSALHD